MAERRRFRIRRGWLLLALVPVAVVILGRSLMPTERVRLLLIDEITRATGAEVVLGEPSVRLVPGLGVRLDGGKIVGTGEALAAATGAPSKLEDYEVRLDRFDVDLGFFALLGGNVRITSVAARGSLMDFSWQDGAARLEEYEIRLKDLALGIESARAAMDRAAGGLPPGEVIPPDLVFVLEARMSRVIAQDALYEDLRLTGPFADRVLTVKEFIATRGGGTITGRCTVDYQVDPHGRFGFEAEASDVPAPELLGPWAPDLAARLEGPLDLRARGGFAMRDRETVLNTLTVKGDLTGGPGVLRAADWLEEATPYLGRRQDLKDVDFRRLTHAFRLEQGRYHVESLAIRGGETDWEGTGWIDLAGSMEVALSVKLPPGFVPELGQWSFLAGGLKDDDGRIGLSFRLVGPTERPEVRVDLASMLQGAR